jgi:hypothetical protein
LHSPIGGGISPIVIAVQYRGANFYYIDRERWLCR